MTATLPAVEKTSISNGMTIEQLWWYANQIANSDFVPRALRGKPLEIFITIQYGSTLGISPLASLHGIAVINGVPSIYGDLLVSLMISHKDFEDQQFEFADVDGDRTCYCHIKRRGRALFTSKFSMNDALRAKLTDKPVWRLYPDSMLMRRAVNTAIHYVFPDALYVGLVTTDSPYHSDGIDETTLVASAKPLSEFEGYSSTGTLDTTNLPASNNETSVVAIDKANDISTRPVNDTSSLVLRDTSKPSIETSLPSVERANNLIGTGNTGRSDIMSVYTDFMNIPSDEKLPHYGILLNILFDYVNCKEVNSKSIDIINKYAGKGQSRISKISDICWGSIDNVPISMLDKMVTRLINHWVPERIAGAETIVHLSGVLGAPDTLFVARSEFYTESACSQYSNARKAGVVVNSVVQDCKDLIVGATPEYDYYTVEFSHLSSIHQDIAGFIETKTFKNDFVDSDFVDNITSLCEKENIDLFVLLNPFNQYPDARLILKTSSDLVTRYFEYLKVVRMDGVKYPNDEECIDIIKQAAKNNTDVFDVARLCTGNCFVSMSEIPLKMLQANGYLTE